MKELHIRERFLAEDVYFPGDVNIKKKIVNNKAPGRNTAALCVVTSKCQQHHLVFSPTPQRSALSTLRPEH